MSLTLRIHAIDEDGAPVAGAIVRHHEQVAVTDADGIANIDELDTDFAAVSVSHAMPAEVELVFGLGEGSSGIVERTVTLRRGALLAGTVCTPDGAPLPEALVEVWSPDRETFVECDAAGAWRVVMRAGPYELRASADGYAHGPAIAGVHDGQAAQHVVLRVARGARLHGRVVDARGQPVAGVRVYAEMHPGQDASATTDADGRYTIVALGAGRHHVAVPGWSANIVLTRDGDERTLDIEMPAPTPRPAPKSDRKSDEPTPGATLIGRVVHDGAPVPRFAIVRKGLADDNWITRPAIIAAPDGRFTLTALHRASCSVHVFALGCAWTSTPTITLEPGVTTDLGDIVLARGAAITGTVRNAAGEPVGGARVTIGSPGRHDDPLGDAAEGNFATTTAADGSFGFAGVPEDASIAAHHPAHGASHQRLVGDELVLVPTGSIAGVIEPFDTARGVVLVSGGESGNAYSTLVRPSGRFVVEDVVPGAYTVALVERPHAPRREARVTVVAGQCADVRIPPP